MSDRRPARVRVYSDNQPAAAPLDTPAKGAAAPAPSTPQRRRTDPGYTGKASGRGGMSSLLLVILFAIGAAGGGALSVALNLVEMPIQ